MLMVHGLNNTPSCMDAWIEQMTDSGIAVVNLALTGHDPADPQTKHRASLDAFLKDLERAHQFARGEFLGLPLYAFGFSLGGVVTALYAETAPAESFSKIIYLAPAFRPLLPAYLLLPLAKLKNWGLSVPAMIPERYRAHATTSIAAGAGLFEGVGKLVELPRPLKIAQIPSLVLMSPKDELVSAKRTRNWVAENAPDWKFAEHLARPERGFAYHHLFLDQSTVGSENWAKAAEDVRGFLESSPR